MGMIEESKSLFVTGNGAVGTIGQTHETESQLGNQRTVFSERNEVRGLGRHFERVLEFQLM